MQSKKHELYWDKIAENNMSFHADFTTDLFFELVPKTAKILDIGCGYGRILKKLVEQGYTNLVGTDVSHKMINKAMQLYPKVKLIHNNDIILPFPDNCFDAIILSSVLGCISKNREQKLLINEIYRVLKNKGYIYVSDFYINDDARNINRYKVFENTAEQPYGVFELSEGVFQRHHSVEYIQDLLSIFKIKLFESRIFQTMCGHNSKGFVYIGSKN